MQDQKTRMTIYLPPEMRSIIEQKAADAGQSLSTWIERALQDKLKPTEAMR